MRICYILSYLVTSLLGARANCVITSPARNNTSSLNVNFSNTNFFGILLIFIINFMLTQQAVAQPSGNETIKSIDNKNWLKAENLAHLSGDKALTKLVLSQKFLDIDYQANNFKDAVNFIKNNPHWPQISKLQKIAETYLNNNTTKKLIVDWFHHHHPKTAKGYKFYAFAASELVKDPNILQPIIKNGWVYGDFTKEEQKQYLLVHSKHLTQHDHVRKIDYLLWNERIEEAKKLIHFAPNSYKEAFFATIASIQNAEDSDSLFRKIASKHYTSSLLFNYLKYKKKSGPDKEILLLFQKIIPEPIYAKEWCKLQIYWAREFLYIKDYQTAYKIITRQFAVDPEDLREAEWHAGWIALRFLHKPTFAQHYFNRFQKSVTTPISLARAYYWLGRCAMAKGDKPKAVELYKLASNYSYTFYGQIASIELKENKIVLPISPKIADNYQQTVRKNEVVRAIEYLINYKKIELAKSYLQSALTQLSKSETLYLLQLVKQSNNLYYTTEFAKLASQKQVFVKEDAFPAPFAMLSSKKVELPLTYAIIRQESVFNHGAVSSKNAMGLMQLIKDTACRTAKSIKIKCDVPKLTKDPHYNMMLGTSHLKDLLKERKGSYILSIASYNAGGHNVDKWINLFGDPRQMKDLHAVLDWLELIPFHETRNYAQRVLEGIQVYRTILNKKPNLQLKKDLLSA